MISSPSHYFPPKRLKFLLFLSNPVGSGAVKGSGTKESGNNFTLPEEQRRHVKSFYLCLIFSWRQMDWIEFSNSAVGSLKLPVLSLFTKRFKITRRWIEKCNFTKQFVCVECEYKLSSAALTTWHWLWLWGLTALLWLWYSYLIILIFSFEFIFRSICVSPADSECDHVSGRSPSLMALLKAKIFLAYFSLPRGFLLLICNSF